jgi:hypothetical protein
MGDTVTTDASAFSAGAAVFLFAATGAALFSAAGFFVHGCPGAARGFFRAYAALLVTFLDMLGPTFLLAAVGTFVASWHEGLLSLRPSVQDATTVPICIGAMTSV